MIRSLVDAIATSVATPFLRRGLSLALAVATSAGSVAVAQITTERLIGDAVSEIGSRYSDVDEAIKRFTNRDVLGAQRFLEAAKQKDPSLPPTELTLAKMYMMANNHARARALLEKTVQEHPEDPEPYLMLADQAVNQRRSIEAEALYEQAMQLVEEFDQNPRRKRNFEIRARTGRSVVAQQRKNWQSALNDLQTLVRLDPENATAQYRLGQVLFMLNNAKDGYAAFVEARRLNRDLPNPYVATALMYDQLGDRSRAQQAFDRAIQEERDNTNTLTSYAQWLIKTGSIQKAEETLDAARRSDPDSLDVLILSGVAAGMAKKMKPAEDYYMDALRLSPTNGGVINQLALLLIDQPDEGKRRRALEFAMMNSRLNNENAEAQITLAWVLYQLGQMAEANAALQTGLQLGNLNPDSNYFVAKLLIDQNQTDAARQLLEGALETENPGIFVHEQEARALLQTLKR